MPKNVSECLGLSRGSRQTETFRDVFLLFLLIFLKARRKNGRKPETFRDVPGSWILGVLTRVSARNSKQIETFRDIPGPWIFGVLTRVCARHSVRSGLRSTLRRPGSSYFRKKLRAFFFSPRSRSGRHHRLLQGHLRPSRIGRLLCCRRSKR